LPEAVHSAPIKRWQGIVIAIICLMVVARLLEDLYATFLQRREARRLDLPDSIEIAADAVELTPSQRGKWLVGEKRSPLGDSLTVVLQEGSEGNSDTLTIQCYHGRTDIIAVLWGKVSPSSGDVSIDLSVRARFDVSPQESETWRFFPTTLGDWAASPNPVFTARRLAKTKRFVIGYNDDNGINHIEVFNPAGLEYLLPRIAEACGWDLATSRKPGS
jgi:hypothetical protein